MPKQKIPTIKLTIIILYSFSPNRIERKTKSAHHNALFAHSEKGRPQISVPLPPAILVLEIEKQAPDLEVLL